MNAYLPRDRVFIPEIDQNGVVVAVRISTYGMEYLVRYTSDGTYYEQWLYDFEVRSVNA